MAAKVEYKPSVKAYTIMGTVNNAKKRKITQFTHAMVQRGGRDLPQRFLESAAMIELDLRDRDACFRLRDVTLSEGEPIDWVIA